VARGHLSFPGVCFWVIFVTATGPKVAEGPSGLLSITMTVSYGTRATPS
jgi:hypothetical protein